MLLLDFYAYAYCCIRGRRVIPFQEHLQFRRCSFGGNFIVIIRDRICPVAQICQIVHRVALRVQLHFSDLQRAVGRSYLYRLARIYVVLQQRYRLRALRELGSALLYGELERRLRLYPVYIYSDGILVRLVIYPVPFIQAYYEALAVFGKTYIERMKDTG